MTQCLEEEGVTCFSVPLHIYKRILKYWLSQFFSSLYKDILCLEKKKKIIILNLRYSHKVASWSWDSLPILLLEYHYSEKMNENKALIKDICIACFSTSPQKTITRYKKSESIRSLMWHKDFNGSII